LSRGINDQLLLGVLRRYLLAAYRHGNTTDSCRESEREPEVVWVGRLSEPEREKETVVCAGGAMEARWREVHRDGKNRETAVK